MEEKIPRLSPFRRASTYCHADPRMSRFGYNAGMKKSYGQELGGWQERMLLASHGARLGYGQGSKETVSGLWLRSNIRLLWLGLMIMFAVVTARLIYLQIFERGLHVLVAENNHIEKIRQTAPRGIIYDRNHEPLVKNIDLGEKGYTREYLHGSAAALVTGYIAEVTEAEVGCEEGICNEPGMLTGRTGVERIWENVLRGKDGGKLVERNARGEDVRELGANTPEPGSDITLTIDLRLQRAIVEALGSRNGSAIAIDMQGKVLGLASVPSYDPNLFTINKNPELLTQMLTDSERQFFLARPTAGLYPPGSVFKLVTAYAGLQEGKLDRETLIEDTGEIRINEYRYGNWYYDQYGRTEGNLNLERALARSNDIFFYRTGEMVGVDQLVKYAKKFGLGQPTGLELPGEQEGLVPDRLWKERQTGEQWFLGNTYHLAIGQGDLQVTPAQVARMASGAVSGRLCRLSLLMDSQITCEDLGLKKENIEVVREGMKQACASGGTAFPFFDFDPWVICKTGTAQHSGQRTEEDKPHAWIAVAYPGENPEMVLVVMLEAAGEGSYEAGPVARQILEKWRESRQ